MSRQGYAKNVRVKRTFKQNSVNKYYFTTKIYAYKDMVSSYWLISEVVSG